MELQLLTGCILALLLGALGQGIRAVAGLKKAHDAGEAFDPSKLTISLFVGGVAGIVGYLGLMFGSLGGADLTRGTTVLGIIAAGYSGADFIDAFTRQWLPK